MAQRHRLEEAIGGETAARIAGKNTAEDGDDLRRFIRQVRGFVDFGYQLRPPWTPLSCDYWAMPPPQA